MSTASLSNGHDPARDVLAEAARRMLPVLAGRVLTAATDRAVDRVDDLAGRLGDIAEHGLPRRAPRDRAEEDADVPDRRPVGTAFAFLAEQARNLLELLVRLLAQAAATLRTATERLRRRRAPEGIDSAEDAGDPAATDGERAAV